MKLFSLFEMFIGINKDTGYFRSGYCNDCVLVSILNLLKEKYKLNNGQWYQSIVKKWEGLLDNKNSISQIPLTIEEITNGEYYGKLSAPNSEELMKKEHGENIDQKYYQTSLTKYSYSLPILIAYDPKRRYLNEDRITVEHMIVLTHNKKRKKKEDHSILAIDNGIQIIIYDEPEPLKNVAVYSVEKNKKN